MTRTPDRLQTSAEWRRIEEEFLAGGGAAALLRGLTAATDAIVQDAYTSLIGPVLPQPAAVLAIGAYGDCQTFPYSGADVILLLETTPDYDSVRDAKSTFARVLWDSGLRLNYTVRTLAECIEIADQNLDLAIGLVSRRFLAGDGGLRARLEDRLPAALARHTKRIATRLSQSARARYARFHNTSHHLEPDVKEAPGGLRDLRLIGWLHKLHPENDAPGPGLAEAGELISTARCFLHYRAGHDANILDLAAQEALAQPPFSLAMREYYRAARRIHHEARRALEESEKGHTSLLDNFREYRTRLSNSDFSVVRERLLLRAPGHLQSDPGLAVRMLEFIARHGVPPAAETERRLEAARPALAAWSADPRPLWPALKTILWSPHTPMALRTLHRTGLLPALFPEWAEIEDRPVAVQERLFCADEHALRSVESAIALRGAMDKDRLPFANLLSEIDNPPLLVFALLFCDTHPDAAAAAMARMQLPAEDRNAVEFLIASRGEFARAMSLDLEDPANARRIAHLAGTVERLKLLTIATYAALTGATTTPMTAERLERLWRAYTVTRDELTRELETERIEDAPEDLPEAAQFVKGFPTRYLRAHSQAEIAAQYELYKRSRPTGAAVQLDALDRAYRLTVIARDRPYLFASFAAAITSFGLDITKAEAFANVKGVILDTFEFHDPKRLLQLNPAESERLQELVQRMATGKPDALRSLRLPPAPDPRSGRSRRRSASIRSPARQPP